MRRLRSDEGGWVLPAALGLLVAMIALGLAVLTVVDAQSTESGRQPQRDAAFNLAETALSSSAFALSRSWPLGSGSQPPWTTAATCAAQTSLAGDASGVAVTGAPALATQVQGLVGQTWAGRPDATGARWSLHVCDDSGAGATRSTLWSDTGLGNAAYDANGREDVPARGDQPASTRRRVWVRAQATVARRTRAVAGLVQVVDQPALPSGYATVTGKISFAAGTGSAVNSMLTGPTTAGTFTKSLFGTTGDTGLVRGGDVGVRCGLLDVLAPTDPNAITCATSAIATVTDIPLVANLDLVKSQVKQFGAPTAASAAAIDRLRQQAIQNGTYYATLPAGPCLTGVAPTADTVTFVEQVGTGDATCTLQADAGTGRTIGTLVVNRGRVDVLAPAGTANGSVNGVIYAMDGQGAKDSGIVHISRQATVRGGVYVDGGGALSIDQPAISSSALVDSLCPSGASLIGGLSCLVVAPALRLLGGDQLVKLLVDGGTIDVVNALGIRVTLTLRATTPTTVLTALLPQFADDAPAIVADATITGRVVTFGSAATIEASFREVPARAGG